MYLGTNYFVTIKYLNWRPQWDKGLPMKHTTSCSKFISVWTKQPLQHWIYLDVTNELVVMLIFLRQCIAQAVVALAVGQLGKVQGNLLFTKDTRKLC